MKTWHNGKLINGKPVIDSLNWTIHYSGSVWEGIRSYVSKKRAYEMYELESHIDRLFQSAKILKIKIPYRKTTLMDACHAVSKANGGNKRDLYLRPVVYKNQDAEGIKSIKEKVNVDIFAIPLSSTLKKNGIKVQTSSRTRSYPVYEMQCKTSNNYGESALWMNEIKQHKVDDLLFTDNHGYYNESSTANLFIVKGGIVYTPPDDGNILPGITRDTIISLAKTIFYFQGIEYKKLTRPDIITADEVFLTGTYLEVVPVVEVDGYKIDNGKVGYFTSELMYLYQDHVRGGEGLKE